MNIYITEHGSRVNIKDNRLIIESADEKKEVPIGIIESLTINKSVQITSQAICKLSEEGIETAWFSGNKLICRTFGNENVLRQKIQFDTLNNKGFTLSFAKRNITAKIVNQLDFVGLSDRFNVNDIKRCDSADELLGVEGGNAAVYFSELKKKIPDTIDFKGRNKSNPSDIVNCMLNYCYTLQQVYRSYIHSWTKSVSRIYALYKNRTLCTKFRLDGESEKYSL